jgi:probable rRNA maturation factor
MDYKVVVRVATKFKAAVKPAVLRAAARAALAHEAAPVPGELTIVVRDDAALRELNRTYLGHDYATDVLSFPADEVDPETGARYIGDIALSLPRARAQAKAAGHLLKAELQLLVVHGVLHLLGHDHAARSEKAKMWKAQEEVLRGLKAEDRKQ